MTRRTPNEITAWEAARQARIEAKERAREAELAADPWEKFWAVADRYRNKFGTALDTWAIDPARFAPLAAAMEAAMLTGKALTVDEATAISGCPLPPLGAVG